MADETWVLVANASSARLFLARRGGKTWSLLEEREHPESRAANHELVSDDRGRVQNCHHPERVAREPRTEPKEVEAQRFAQELSNRLARGADDRAYARLMIVAPPRFLGLLRTTLDTAVTRRVIATIDKDYHGLDARALAAQIGGSLSAGSSAAARRARGAPRRP